MKQSMALTHSQSELKKTLGEPMWAQSNTRIRPRLTDERFRLGSAFHLPHRRACKEETMIWFINRHPDSRIL